MAKTFIDNTGVSSSLTTIASSTAVTVNNPTAATDTQMIELALPKGYLNTAKQGWLIRAGGVFSTTTASSPQITITAKLCTVSGCGSGTVVSLGAIQSGAASATAATNNSWTYGLYSVTNATGATGNILSKGDPGLVIDLSNVVSAADTVYSDPNTATSSNIDLTAALFLDFTVAQSTTGASNSYKQLSGFISPQVNFPQLPIGGGVNLSRRTCDIAIGDTSSASAITNAQLGPQSRICYIPANSTIQELVVAADAGTPNVIVRKNSAGTTSNIVSSALATAASGGIACSNASGTTGLDGVTTCSSTLQNTSLLTGDYLELTSGTAGGTAKLMTIHVIYTIN